MLRASVGKRALHVFSFDARSGMLGASFLLKHGYQTTNRAQNIEIRANTN
jgi:hypothetical protein